MIRPEINTVLHAFIILLEGDEEVIPGLELISTQTIQRWCSAKVKILPLDVRSTISFELKTKKEYLNYLKKVVRHEELSQNTYRCVVSHIFEHHFENIPTHSNDQTWIRLFVFLFNLSKKISTPNLDHEILTYNSSNELIAHFDDDFDLIEIEAGRLRSQLTGLFFCLKIYKEFTFYNWKFFPLINQLITARFQEIRKVNPETGKVKYKNPQHYLFS